MAETPDGCVDLTYEFLGWPGRPGGIRRRVEDMLDLIATAINRGTI